MLVIESYHLTTSNTNIKTTETMMRSTEDNVLNLATMELTPIPLKQIERVDNRAVSSSPAIESVVVEVPQLHLPVTLNAYKNTRVSKEAASKPLPIEFTPTPYSVVCGRGKVCTDAVGNRRLKIIASMFLDKYANANTREEKSAIVTEIMDIIEDACPDKKGAFVRYNDGRWWMVDTMAAREKVGALLRDCLHSKYRSSSKSKQAKRRRMSEQTKQSPRPRCNCTKPCSCAARRRSSV